MGAGFRNCQVAECHLASVLTLITEPVWKVTTLIPKKVRWVIAMFIALHAYYQHCHFHLELILYLYCEHTENHRPTLFCCIISIHCKTSSLLMALYWVSKLYSVSTKEQHIQKQWITGMNLFPDTFQNPCKERKCARIMGDYANNCAAVYSVVCYVDPFLLSKAWRVEEHIKSVFISCIVMNSIHQSNCITAVKCIYKW